ncbi:aggregation-promoting factor C-terminal-like domain-containing protein [Streptomyces lydicus]|uniref:aggregation-promoting factor C-terminal-like domain-containing protein n=1 Tax=Streptomyces lydicus TaxID=47763 RepID=UPI0037A057E3
MADLDIVGSAGVDIVPVLPQFHTKLKTAALPIADRVGEEMGRRIGEAIGNNIVVALPQAINQGGRAAQAAATRQGDNAGGAFARSLKTKLEVAFKAMPKLDVRLSDTGVDAELARLRARMETLSQKRIGIDVDAAAAEAEIVRIEAELTRLGASHPNVSVRADTATARAALAEIRAEIAAVDAAEPDVKVDVNTGSASSALVSLGIQMGLIAAIPLGPVIAAGLGAVVSAAAAAGAGIGALALAAVPSISAVRNVLTQQKAAQDAATKSTTDGGNAARQAAQHALTMANAQQTLTAAHRTAAQSIAQANRQVADAERAVGDAAQRAAEQRKQAADNVKRAEQGVVDAQRGVRQAEQSLTDAQRAARQAQDDLTAARKLAAQQLRDLDNALADGALNQREATLRVQEAQQELQRTMADPKATQLQRDQAQLTFDQAVQHAKEQKQDYTDLQKSAAAQKKAGVDGSDAVRAAMERLSAANRAVKDQSDSVAVAQQKVTSSLQALRDAQDGVTKAQVAGARLIADAQQHVKDAVQAAANAQVTAAQQIAAAERGVQSARLSGMQTTSQAATKSDAYRQALAKLTPEQRKLYDSVAGPRGLKPAFDAWQKSLQPYVLPLFTRGVNGLKNTLPSLTPLVKDAASAIHDLQNRASRNLKSPFWQGFKADIQKSVKPAIKGVGISFGNVFKGMAGVIRAFLPHMDGISSRMQKLTARFANWGKGLKGSPEFEKFLKYVKDVGPKISGALKKIFGALFQVGRDLSPISGPLYDLISGIADFIGTIAEHAPWMIQIIYAVIIAVKLWTLAQIALNLAMDANPITLIILAIAGIVAVVIYCYNKFTWFKKTVDWVWNAIKAVIGFVWRTFLKPVFDALRWALGKIGEAFKWLWEHAVKPVMGWIGDKIKWVWEHLIKPGLDAWKQIFKALGAAAHWLWEHAIKPVFGWIGDKVKWVWEHLIKPGLEAWKWILGKVGDALKWLWDVAVKPVFNWIGDKATWLWEHGIKPAFDKIKFIADHTGEVFRQMKKDIGEQWNALVGILKTPAKIIIDTVYNRGIVPLWNGIADVTGAGKISKVSLRGFSTGGVMPGYTPGVDNQIIAVGGGEAIMRPEWTRAVGPDYVHAMNAAARSGGVSAVRRAVNGGMPAFADGGIVGLAKKTWDYATDPSGLFDAMKDAATKIVGGLTQSPWVKHIGRIPGAALDSLETKALSWLGLGSGGGVASIGKALKFAMAEAGKPYQWGGVGNPSWDCSGFMGAIQKVIEGRNPKGRIWSTFSFQGDHAPAGWKRNVPAPFMIGVTNRGKGHTAGTLAGVNVESRGGDGVVVGNRARGARNSFFDDVYGFMPSLANGGAMADVATAQQTARQMLGEFGWGDRQWAPLKALWQHESGWRWNAKNPSTGAYGIPQSLPASKMASAGADYLTNAATQIKWGMGYIKNRPDYGSPAAAWAKWQARSPHWYDSGGYLPEGLSLVANGTGKPEPVFTDGQWAVLKGNVGGGRGDIQIENHVWLGDREITDIVDHRIVVHEHATARAISDGRRF